MCFGNNNNCSCLILILIILLLFSGCGTCNSCGGSVGGTSDNGCGCC